MHVAVMEVDKEEDVVVFGYVDSPVVVKVNKDDHHVVSPPFRMETCVGNGEVVDRERFDDGDEFVLSKPVWNSPEKTTKPPVVESSPLSSAEKPPFSARFGHRRAVKASPEGKSLNSLCTKASLMYCFHCEMM